MSTEDMPCMSMVTGVASDVVPVLHMQNSRDDTPSCRWLCQWRDEGQQEEKNDENDPAADNNTVCGSMDGSMDDGVGNAPGNNLLRLRVPMSIASVQHAVREEAACLTLQLLDGNTDDSSPASGEGGVHHEEAHHSCYSNKPSSPTKKARPRSRILSDDRGSMGREGGVLREVGLKGAMASMGRGMLEGSSTGSADSTGSTGSTGSAPTVLGTVKLLPEEFEAVLRASSGVQGRWYPLDGGGRVRCAISAGNR
jgi:hypothetical protein